MPADYFDIKMMIACLEEMYAQGHGVMSYADFKKVLHNRDAEQRNGAVLPQQICPACKSEGYLHVVGTDYRTRLADDGQI